MSEDAPVANDGDSERQQPADDDKEDGVVICGSAVPQTLLSLGVEPVRRPTKVVRWVKCETGHPHWNDSNDSTTASEHCVILVVPANVQVTVDSDERDGNRWFCFSDISFDASTILSAQVSRPVIPSYMLTTTWCSSWQRCPSVKLITARLARPCNWYCCLLGHVDRVWWRPSHTEHEARSFYPALI